MATARNLSRSVQRGSEEAYDYICASCECRDNISVEAHTYCADCDDFYCVKCMDINKALPALKPHTIFGPGQVTEWCKEKQSASAPTEKCPSHSEKVLEIYCGNHDALCCHVCVVIDHRVIAAVFNCGITNATTTISDTSECSGSSWKDVIFTTAMIGNSHPGVAFDLRLTQEQLNVVQGMLTSRLFSRMVE